MSTLDLRGTPFPFGLTYVPHETLAPVVGGVRGPVEDLCEACVSLGASFAFVPADAPWAADAVEALVEAGVAPLWSVGGPLWPVIGSWGEMEGLRATLTDPAAVGERLEASLDGVLELVSSGVDAGARAVVLAEDVAGSGGPLVAPDFAIAELLPRYARVVESARALGVPAVFHSDGDVRPLLPAIASAGFVALHSGGGLGFEAFDRLFWTAREAGLAVIGGLLTGELGNAARAEAIGSTIGVLAQAGGLLVADDGGITTEREVAGLVTALEAARAV